MVSKHRGVIGIGLALGAVGLSLLAGGCRRQLALAPAAPAASAPETAAADTAPKTVAHTGSSGALAVFEESIEAVYAKLNKSVVNIQVTTAGTEDQVLERFGMPFEGPENPRGHSHQGAPKGHGSGSGFVWDKAGDIITNNHVVADAESIRVTFSDGTTVTGKVKGADHDSDLAVVKVDLPPERLEPVTMADSSQVKVGQVAIAIGNPFGLEGSMTVGFVSALGRLLPTTPDSTNGGNEPTYTIPDVLQTDAPINPGNSGGVLADGNGSVIGVTSAIISPARANAGIGFAIPSAIVSKVVPVLIASGKVEHPYLGVVGVTLTPEEAKAMGLKPEQRGGLVVDVVTGGPCDKAGIRGSDRKIKVDDEDLPVGGDVITALAGKPVKSFDDVVTELARTGEVGKSVELTVLREGKEQKISVALTARPGSHAESAKGKAGAEGEGVKLGIAGVDLTPEMARAMGLGGEQRGVLVQAVEQSSAADKAGLRGGYKPLPGDRSTKLGGDVITAVDGQAVGDMGDLEQILSRLKPGSSATLTILRGGKKTSVKVTF
jgi:2-alkenal reductase